MRIAWAGEDVRSVAVEVKLNGETHVELITSFRVRLHLSVQRSASVTANKPSMLVFDRIGSCDLGVDDNPEVWISVHIDERRGGDGWGKRSPGSAGTRSGV